MKQILGIDEVGRGPYAGPLVVGACLLLEPLEGLTDSKKLTPRRREKIAAAIREASLSGGLVWGLGWIPAPALDELGMTAALCMACRLAVHEVSLQCSALGVAASDAVNGCFGDVIIDGTINFLRGTALESQVEVVAKADLLVPAVSAASIIAKVSRDEFMSSVASAAFPEYGFEGHMGYGTAKHSAAIQTCGVCPEHRRSFKPIALAVEAGGCDGCGVRGGHGTHGGRDGRSGLFDASYLLQSLEYVRDVEHSGVYFGKKLWMDSAVLRERLGEPDKLLAELKAGGFPVGAAEDFNGESARCDSAFPRGRNSQHLTEEPKIELATKEQGSGKSGQKCAEAKSAKKPTTKELGDKAENLAAKMLASKGHEIIARNWKNKFCEIDIVSEFESCLYFTEVKYRKTAKRGSGLEAISAKKLEKMRFAAELFSMQEKCAEGKEMSLAAIEVSGEDFQLGEWMPLV